MSAAQQPEVWMRGPVEGYHPQLMPVVHALLQVREDIARLAAEVPPAYVWARPGGAASIGFHVRHLAGALDRLVTYARGESLTRTQLASLSGEAEPGDPPATIEAVVADATQAIDARLAELREWPAATFDDARGIGRRQLPSTVRGLLFHAAEHATRHAGQAITTAIVLRGAPVS